jgi:hypothetical protein
MPGRGLVGMHGRREGPSATLQPVRFLRVFPDALATQQGLPAAHLKVAAAPTREDFSLGSDFDGARSRSKSTSLREPLWSADQRRRIQRSEAKPIDLGPAPRWSAFSDCRLAIARSLDPTRRVRCA